MTKNEKIKVSVIMPSLNVVDYIEECLESVINQSLREIEIICVDAKSNDGTLTILRKYKRKDNRIQVIISDKKSYGYQVNLGFAKAKGEYVAIVETDDYIATDMYETLYNIAKENDLDFIKGDFAQFKGDGNNRVFTHRKIVQSDYFYNRVFWVGDELDAVNGSIYPWAGIYKRNLIIDNNIKLNETPGASYQDNGLAFQVYAYGKRGYYLEKEFYYLRREEQDASFYAPHKVDEIFKEFDYIYEFLIESGYYKVFAPRFWKLKYQTFCWRANMVADEHKLEFMKKFSDDFKCAFRKGILDSKFFNKSEKEYLQQIMDSPELVCWKKFYTSESVWQRESNIRDAEELPNQRIPIKKKKILFITNELSYSGAQLSGLSQCIILSKAGAYVEVWSLKEGELQSQYENNGFIVKIIYPHEFDRSYIQDRIMQFDLAVINTILTVAAADVCMKLIPTILYVRSDGKLFVHFLQNAIMFQNHYNRFNVLKNAKYIVAVSDYCGDWVVENINPNVNVINNFLEDKYNDYEHMEHKSAPSEKIKFTALGTIEYRKGFDIYLDAFNLLPIDYQNKCEIHFAGRKLDGCEEFYQKIISKAQNMPNCHYHGDIQERDDIYKLIMESDVIVIPSRNESFSRVVLEGAMLGKPIIVTEDVGASYLIDDSNGWIIKTEDVKALENVFREIIDNPTALKEMGLKAREAYLNNSTEKIYAQNFVKYVERVLKANEKKNHINYCEYKLYSFDVFDTLITRKTALPTGIFALVEEKLKNLPGYSKIDEHFKNNFYNLRINAEKLARFMSNGNEFKRMQPDYIVNEEVNLEEIYNVFVFSGLLTEEQSTEIMNLEIETEIENIVPISRNIDYMKELLKVGAKVIVISEMYHSEKVVRRMLSSVDSLFDNIPIYVSSEFMLNKASGNLYRKIQEMEKIEYDKWQHTGDSKLRDQDVPKQLGINSVLYPIAWINNMENYMLGDFIDDCNVQKYVACARNTRVINNLTGKAALGTDLGLFVLVPYVEFILRSCQERKIKNLYFIARDGYVLQKIANVIIRQRNLNIKTNYIYGSRNAWRVFSENVSDIDIISLISYSNFNHIDSLEKLADVFSITYEELISFLSEEYKKENVLRREILYQIAEQLNNNEKFKKLLIKKHSRKRDLLIKYLKQEIDSSNDDFAFVELNGTGVSIDFMSKILYSVQEKRSPVKTFFYWATNTELKHKSHEFISFLPSKLSKGSIIECLCRAPHAQAIGYCEEKGKIVPEFANGDDYSMLEKVGYEDYIKGVLLATEYYCDNDVEIPTATVERAINYIVNKPDAEMLAFLGDIPFEVSGRSEKVMTFAPHMSPEDIFNLYFRRHINRESIEKYFPVSYFDYCLLRNTQWDKSLIDYYTKLLAEYNKKRMLYKLTEEDLAVIRKQAENMNFKNGVNVNINLVPLLASKSVPKSVSKTEPKLVAKPEPKPEPKVTPVQIQSTTATNVDQTEVINKAVAEAIDVVYNSYSYRIGHKIVTFANIFRNMGINKKRREHKSSQD